MVRPTRFELALLLIIVGSTAGVAQSSQADWVSAAVSAIRDTRTPAPVSARALAITHTCMYDAWAAYDDRAVGTQLYGKTQFNIVAQRPDLSRCGIISSNRHSHCFARFRCS